MGGQLDFIAWRFWNVKKWSRRLGKKQAFPTKIGKTSATCGEFVKIKLPSVESPCLIVVYCSQ